jgi:hypothetical protein
MQKFNLTLLNPETIDELLKIANEHPEYTCLDAIEEISKKSPNLIKEIGSIDENGNMTKINITEEGIEIKKINLSHEINKIIKLK